MSQHHTIRLSSWARLVGLALLLGVGVLASLGLSSRTAHAQPASTSTVNPCTEAALDAAINNAASGDTITFGCSGTITLSQTLVINKNLTLDGSGQSVTLDGNNSVEVLSVNSGVSFTLNVLTIAHGSVAGPHDGGGLANNGGTVSIGGSIVANNSGGNCIGGDSDQGYNLSSDSSCGFTASTDQQNTDPKLASALASNGGPTQTLALLDGSPAINHIPSSVCPSADQRGVSRPQGPACDIGAFEFRVPKLSLPGTVTANATSSQGAVVSYTVTASEPDDASATPSVSCSPASGSTFPIGTTTVHCSASDAANSPDVTTGSFQVVVKGAAAQVSDLIATVNGMGLSKSLQAALDAKLNDVLTAINGGQTATACSDLTDFIGYVQSHIGKGLTTSQVNQLIAAAKQVRAVLGC